MRDSDLQFIIFITVVAVVILLVKYFRLKSRSQSELSQLKILFNEKQDVKAINEQLNVGNGVLLRECQALARAPPAEIRGSTASRKYKTSADVTTRSALSTSFAAAFIRTLCTSSVSAASLHESLEADVTTLLQ